MDISTYLHYLKKYVWPNFGKPMMYPLAWILKNTDLKYLKYHTLIMFGSSHVRFTPEIQ